MRGCSVAILVLNVLDDSVCRLKDKEGRSLDYSVTSGTVHFSLSLLPSSSFYNTHTHIHTRFPSFLFYFPFPPALPLSPSHTRAHTLLFCAMVHIPPQFCIISWCRAPSTGPILNTSAAAQVSLTSFLETNISLDSATCSRGISTEKWQAAFINIFKMNTLKGPFFSENYAPMKHKVFQSIGPRLGCYRRRKYWKCFFMRCTSSTCESDKIVFLLKLLICIMTKIQIKVFNF